MPIVAISPAGTVTKANVAARRILSRAIGTDKEALGEMNLGEMLARFIGRRDEPGIVATIALPHAADKASTRVAVVMTSGEGDPETASSPPAGQVARSEDESALRERRLGDFIAHELRNPIASILGLSRTVRLRYQALSPQDRDEALTAIQSESERALLIVNGILRLAQFRTRGDRANIPIPLHLVVQNLLVEHRRRYSERTIEQTGDWPAYAIGDPTGVELALGNLLNNAEKYTPRWGNIEVRVNQEGGRIAILVLNDGGSLTPDRYRSMWDTYEQADSADPSVTGSGIGLALCKDLTEAMGGSVWAGPKQSGGSCFAITLRAETEIDAEAPLELSTAPGGLSRAIHE